MNTSKHLLPLLVASAVATSSLSAAILAYEGFATDATGSGANYENGLLLEGQGATQPREGFTGSWSAVGNAVSENINVRTATGGLSYPGFVTGTPGTANPFRIGNRPGGAGSNNGKWIGRDLTVTNVGGQLENGYYVAALIDFNGASGGGFGWSSNGTRDNYFDYNFNPESGQEVTFQSGGQSGASTSFSPAAGTNLFVLQYTNEAGGPNADFYTRWNLWVNPDLSDGELGAVDATGFGIGLLENGAVANLTQMFVSASNLSNAEMFVDELYITTTPSAFIIPEPSTYALVASLAILCGVALYRRRQ